MKSRYLPGFDTAGSNVSLITTDGFPSSVLAATRSGETTELRSLDMRKLSRYRRISQIIKTITSHEISEDLDASNWDELSTSLFNNVSAAIWRRILNESRETREQINADVIMNDAFSGAAQITAFHELVVRSVAAASPTDVTNSLDTIIRQSKGFLIHSSALDDTTEAEMTYALARPKPNLRSHRPHEGLRYHTKWFQYNPRGAVELNPNKVTDMRDSSNKHPLAHGTPDDIWFGCPARVLLTPMINCAVAAASRDQLLEASYRLERQNLGY